jgi:hypothetical protein
MRPAWQFVWPRLRAFWRPRLGWVSDEWLRSAELAALKGRL